MSPPETTAIGVSAVVCAFSDERRGTLLRALRSLAGQTQPPAEVIVVVDHNPGLHDWLLTNAPTVRVVASDQPRGLAGARNCGIDAASAEVVAFLDDDAHAAPDWLERLCLAYADPRVIGVGGAVVPEFERGRPRWLPEEFDWVIGCTYRGLPRSTAPVRNLIGCNMSFRRDALARAGGFSPALGRVASDGSGCEETELCIRLGRENPDGVLLYDPHARVSHHVPAERARVRYFIARCRAEGMSKAIVARLCGLDSGLESERAYTRRTLPAGVRNGLRAGFQGDPAGLARAGMIALGLVTTAIGFAAAPRSWTEAR